jgi:methylated-DNA-[protein]-cysteine S-methyltransferase
MNTDDLKMLDLDGHDEAVGRFAEAAFTDGAAQVAYGSIPSPIGAMLCAMSHSGVLALAFDSQDADDVLGVISRKFSPAIVDLPTAVAPVREQLDAYFGARLRAFDLDLDRSLLTPFQRGVLGATELIPMGEVRTYGEMAAAAGRPKGAQAAGQALGANPIPIVIPCHRVVAANGNLTGYAGGLERKRFLLELERGERSLF